MLRKEAGGRLDQWAASPSGGLFLDHERKQVETLISPSVHGEAPLWLSAFQCKPPVEAVLICSRDDDASGLGGMTVIAREFELPFANQQFSTIISSHVHEYTEDPHEYLRELARITEPEGQLIISGFNPFNLFGIGLRHKLYKREGAPVYPSHYLSVYRLKDWLRLLGFELEGGSYFYYLPLSRSPFVLHKLEWMERAGNRWWPRASGGFILTARKRMPGMTPLVKKNRLRLWSPSPQPVIATGKYEHR